MKKILNALLVIVMIFSLATFAEAEDAVPQPEGGKKFERDWAIGDGLVRVWYEEEGYRVLVSIGWPEKSAGAEWEYSCYYVEEKDALISVSSSRTDYTVRYEDGEKVYAEPAYEGFDEEGRETAFTIDGHGCLIWKDGREDAGAGLEFRDIGRFEGVWRNEEEEVEAEFIWNGDPDSLFYTVYIQRGKTGADTYALYLMNGFYDPETGKLEADGTCTVFKKNADGEYDSEDDGETWDAFFSMTEDGKLLYETANGIELEYDLMGPES